MGATRPDGGSAKPERVVFTRNAADRIADAVLKVERGNRDSQGLSWFPRMDGLGGGKTFRICTFTGSWSIGELKTVTFRNQTTTPNTVAATNLVIGLNPSGECDVSIAKEGTAWYLIQPNLTQQPGYSESGTQVMTIVNGSLQWVGVADCSTEPT